MASARASSSLIAYLQERVVEGVEGLPGVTRRKVLASDGWFVDDKLFTFVNRQARVVVRLPDAAAADELLATPGATPWQYGKKAPMRGWLLLPEDMHDDAEALRRWVHRAHGLVRVGVPAPARGKRRRAAAAQKPRRRAAPSR